MEPHRLPPNPFSGRGISDLPSNFGETLSNIFTSFFYWLQVVSLFASLFLVLGIIYSVVRINHVRKKEKEEFGAAIVPISAAPTSSVPETNPRWERIRTLASSESEQDWRVAILEADIMLSDMLTRMQYDGDTVGEKLKSVEKSDFTSLDSAWEAHKVRNQIAHAGSEFYLSKREVDRTIALYRSVFDEFHFI